MAYARVGYSITPCFLKYSCLTSDVRPLLGTWSAVQVFCSLGAAFIQSWSYMLRAWRATILVRDCPALFWTPSPLMAALGSAELREVEGRAHG
jgi:hypothetical protein